MELFDSDERVTYSMCCGRAEGLRSLLVFVTDASFGWQLQG
jgi:hypothetical protein